MIWGRYKKIVTISKLNPKLPTTLEKFSKLKRYAKIINMKQIPTKNRIYRLQLGLKNIIIINPESKKGIRNLSRELKLNPYSRR